MPTDSNIKMIGMRTTLTIDDDTANELKRRARFSGRSFKETVNEVLRRGLTADVQQRGAAERFVVAAAPRGFQPGVDPLKLNQLADELEVDDFVDQHRTAGP